VDAAQLRLKLEKLVGHSMRFPSKDINPPGSSRVTSARDPSPQKNQPGDMSSRSMGPSTPLSVHSVSVPPWPTTPTSPTPSQLPWLQLSGSQFSMPSFRALQAIAGDFCERPVFTQGAERPSSASGAGLPPLPGAVADTIVAPHTLRNLARASRRKDLDSSRRDWRSQSDTALGHPDARPLHRIRESRPSSGSSNDKWRAPRERKGDISRQLFNSGLPRKRSRLKRILFRLWRFGRPP